MWCKKVRYRSAENVISEIEQIIESTGIRQFGIWDDSLTTHKKRCLEFCNLLQKLNIAWKCSARADSLDPEICETLMDAGCKEVAVGLESGDQRVLNFIGKRTNMKATIQGCEYANDAGLKLRGMFITGLPGEREDTPELTIEYIQDLNLNMICLFLFTPLPGSPIWNDPKKYNCEILTKDFTIYNEYYYVMKNGEKVRNEFRPIIHNKFLTMNQMEDNIGRMRTYVEETGKCNEG